MRQRDRFRFAPRERACADPQSACSEIVLSASERGRCSDACSAHEATVRESSVLGFRRVAKHRVLVPDLGRGLIAPDRQPAP